MYLYCTKPDVLEFIEYAMVIFIHVDIPDSHVCMNIPLQIVAMLCYTQSIYSKFKGTI